MRCWPAAELSRLDRQGNPAAVGTHEGDRAHSAAAIGSAQTSERLSGDVTRQTLSLSRWVGSLLAPDSPRRLPCAAARFSIWPTSKPAIREHGKASVTVIPGRFPAAIEEPASALNIKELPI